jgi:hypothetical protein
VAPKNPQLNIRLGLARFTDKMHGIPAELAISGRLFEKDCFVHGGFGPNRT